MRIRTRRPAPAEARVADMVDVDTRRAEPDYQRGQYWHLHLVVFIESLR